MNDHDQARAELVESFQAPDAGPATEQTLEFRCEIVNHLLAHPDLILRALGMKEVGAALGPRSPRLG